MVTRVAVFLGQPGPKSGPRRQAAAARQIARWQATPLVTVHARPLRYLATGWENGRPTSWRSGEKGIDVLMALAIALGARDNRYDVGVVVSADSDLAPAIDVALAAGKDIETAMWWTEQDRNRRLRTGSLQLTHRKFDADLFGWVADRTDYATASGAP